MTCDQRRDLLLLYAADALDADEVAELRRHLRTGCPACAGHLAEAQAVLASLPLGLDPVVPPEHLKEKLMRRIDTESISVAQPSRMRIMRYLVPAALAAGVAIVATHSVMMQRVNDLQHQSDTWQQRTADATAQVQQLQQLQNQFRSQSQMVEMLQSPAVKLIPLHPTEFQPKATANLLWNQKTRQWAVLTTGMTPAAAGQTYELWFITSAGPTRAGVFDVDANGTGSLLADIPPGIGDLKVAAITNEKAGGVPRPQGNIQIKGSVE